jgi:hypothetical protein
MQCFQKISLLCCGKDSLENTVSLSKAKSHYQNSNGNYNKISNGLILSPQGEQVVCDYGKILLQ